MAVGSLAVRVSAQTRQYIQGMKGTLGPARDLRRSMNRVAVRAGQMTAAVTAAGAAITGAMVNSSIQAATEQRRLATSLELTNRQVAGLTSAFRAYNLEQDDVSDAINTLTDRARDAVDGMQSMADDFSLVGLEVDDLRGKKPDELLTTFANAIASTEDPTKRAAAVVRTFGDDLGRKLLPLLMQGEEGLQRFESQATQLGLAFDNVDAERLEQAHQSMSTLDDVIQGVSNRVSVQLAPLISVIAGRFQEAAVESEGFKDTVNESMQGSVNAIGQILDAIEGIRRTFLVAGKGAATFALETNEQLLHLANAIMSGPVQAINFLIDQANNIPGINIGKVEQPDIVSGIREQINLSHQAVQEGKQEIQAILMEPMPSTQLEQFWQDVQNEADKAKDKFESAHNAAGQQVDVPGVEGEEGEEKSNAEEERKRQKKRMAILREFSALEMKFENEQYQQELERLRTARENELITEKEYNKAKQQLAQEHQSALSNIEMQGISQREKFERASMSQRVSTVAADLKSMTQSVANENKTMFEINKAAAIATAAVDAIKGAEKTWNAYPYPWNIPMTAAHVAASAARISSIKSQSFSGGATAPSATSAGSGAPAGSQPVNQAGGGGDGGAGGPATIINLQGERFGKQQVRDLIDQLNEENRDGGRILVQ